VLDPGKLEYVILLPFDVDECGGMDRFLEGAPSSTLACSAASVQLNLRAPRSGPRESRGKRNARISSRTQKPATIAMVMSLPPRAARRPCERRPARGHADLGDTAALNA
jgi:hypothetical protein